MSDIMRVRHNTEEYWDNLLRTANQEKNLTNAAMARLAARLLRVRAGNYGKRLKDDAKAQLMADAIAYLKLQGLSGRASKRGAALINSRDKILAARRAKIGAPWYWNLSSVRSKGINPEGIDRAVANTTYRNALTQAMKKFANDWAAVGNDIPVHGFF